MRNFGKVGLFALALSALSVTAYAADTSGRGAVQSDQPASTGTAPGGAGAGGAVTRDGWPSFSQADQDGTGFISQEEAANIPELNFMSSDTDGDGRLSRSEYEASMRGAPATGSEGGSPVGPSGGSGPSGSSPSGSGGYPGR